MTDFAQTELTQCFKYFYENFSRGENTYGMMPDKVPDNHGVCSVAANGFMLAAMAVGADFGLISQMEGAEICVKTIETFYKLDNFDGFFFHFYSMKDCSHTQWCEVSSIDTALLFAGALAAGGYFGGEVLTLARQLAGKCDWRSFYDKNRKQFYMARYGKQLRGYWDVYAEQLVMYFLAAATPSFEPYALDAYNGFARLEGHYGDIEFLYSWFGSLFTHQYSHAFLDFRNRVDANGTNWFENSVKASLANRKFCIDLGKTTIGVGENSWGLTSCLTKQGYIGNIGTPPSGNGNIEHRAEATVAPAGAIGSVVFTPSQSLAALNFYYSLDKLVGEYGLKDSFNLSQNWFADEYISIDKGISLLMLANYFKQTVWNSVMSLAEIKRAFAVLNFKEEHNG